MTRVSPVLLLLFGRGTAPSAHIPHCNTNLHEAVCLCATTMGHVVCVLLSNHASSAFSTAAPSAHITITQQENNHTHHHNFSKQAEA